MYEFWIDPFGANLQVRGRDLNAMRLTWDALHSQGFALSARP